MAIHCIPPTPDNFAGWLRYAAGTSPALKKAIEIIAGNKLGVMMIDIDHFKRFNASFFHQVGDQVLRLVANVLRSRYAITISLRVTAVRK